MMMMMMPSAILRRIWKTEVQGSLRPGARFREVHAFMEERKGGREEEGVLILTCCLHLLIFVTW